MTSEMTRGYVAFEVLRAMRSRNQCITEALVWFGPTKWAQVQDAPRTITADLGPHEWWRHLSPDDVHYVLQVMAEHGVFVPSREASLTLR